LRLAGEGVFKRIFKNRENDPGRAKFQRFETLVRAPGTLSSGLGKRHILLRVPPQKGGVKKDGSSHRWGSGEGQNGRAIAPEMTTYREFKNLLERANWRIGKGNM